MIQWLSQKDAQILERAGIESAQIVSVHNAPQALVTITRVTMAPMATSARHRHPHSEQIWLVERGTATLLLDAGQVAEIGAGDVIRTSPGEVHGVTNTGSEPFVYLAVTTPPQDFTDAYLGTKQPGQ